MSHPGVVIELETNHRSVDPARRDFDIWIAYVGETAAPDLSRASGFRLYSMVVAAAVKGMGTAIGHSRVIAGLPT